MNQILFILLQFDCQQQLMQNCNSGISLKLDGYPCTMGHLKTTFLDFPTPGTTRSVRDIKSWWMFFSILPIFCQYFAWFFNSHDALRVSTIYKMLDSSILMEITDRNYSLISMRLIYYFDTWAIIWQGIVLLFLKICTDLQEIFSISAQNCFCYCFWNKFSKLRT